MRSRELSVLQKKNLVCCSQNYTHLQQFASMEDDVPPVANEPRCEKTGLRGFRLGPTQTGLYCHRRWLEA